MDLGLSGKVALVAAASRGLGRAVAAELAREGTTLVLCARGPEKLREAAAAIADSSQVEVLAVSGDVSSKEDVKRIVNSGIDRFGRIDILVTNAGGPPAGRFESLSRDAWESATRLTLDSVIELTRHVVPGMKERQWGRILNITSIAVKQPVDNLMLSNTLRAAVTGFARTLANELAPDGITVNNILPGYTRTERVEELAQSMAAKEGTRPEDFLINWEK
jgi:3-oxoacyl-[acyl-carrier protein] reductase